jgi:hypothetical protein
LDSVAQTSGFTLELSGDMSHIRLVERENVTKQG